MLAVLLLLVSTISIQSMNATARAERFLPGACERGGPLTCTFKLKDVPTSVAIEEGSPRAFVLHTDADTTVDPQACDRSVCRGSVSMIDLTKMQLVRTVSVGSAPGLPLVDRLTHRLFVVDERGDGDGTVYTIDTRTGRVVGRIQAGLCPCSTALAAKTNRVFVSTSAGLRMLDATSGAVIRTLPSLAGSVVIDDRLNRAYTYGPGGMVVADAASGRALRTWKVGECRGQIAIDQRHDRLYTARAVDGTGSNQSQGYFCVIDARSGTIRATIKEGVGVTTRVLAVDSVAGTVVLFTHGYVGNGPVRVVHGLTGETIRILEDATPIPPPIVGAKTGTVYYMARVRYDPASRREVSALLRLNRLREEPELLVNKLALPSEMVLSATHKYLLLPSPSLKSLLVLHL